MNFVVIGLLLGNCAYSIACHFLRNRTEFGESERIRDNNRVGKRLPLGDITQFWRNQGNSDNWGFLLACRLMACYWAVLVSR